MSEFAIVITSARFDQVVEICRDYLIGYYREMYADDPSFEDPRVVEFWGNDARWMEEFRSSHLKGWKTLTQVYSAQGMSEDFIQRALEAGEENDLNPKGIDLWGEARVVSPAEAADRTVIDFPERSIWWQFLDVLISALDAPVFSFRYCAHGDVESDGDHGRFPVFAEIEARTKFGVVRTVRRSWAPIMKPVKGRDFRQTFEEEGVPQDFELTEKYAERLISKRLNREVIFDSIRNLGLSPEALIDEQRVNKAVLIASPEAGA